MPGRVCTVTVEVVTMVVEVPVENRVRVGDGMQTAMNS